ncbi:hypothetical protein Ancab_029630 [Ancistrocladus abbreviatus]
MNIQIDYSKERNTHAYGDHVFCRARGGHHVPVSFFCSHLEENLFGMGKGQINMQATKICSFVLLTSVFLLNCRLAIEGEPCEEGWLRNRMALSKPQRFIS